MSNDVFEKMLRGGHPNSLGNTLEVVDKIFSDNSLLGVLIDTYSSKDEVVRLRVSNALKRVCKEHPDWVIVYLDRLLDEISSIDQASTKWTLATIFMWLEGKMTDVQKKKAISIMKKNLVEDRDWIVILNTFESLIHFIPYDNDLKEWLLLRLEVATKDSRKSVSKRASKYLVKVKEM